MANILHFLVTPGNPSDIGCIALRSLDLQSNQLLAAYHYPRVIHTHYKPNMLPDDAFKKGRNVVLVFRNPKTPLSQCSSFFRTNKVISDGFNVSWNAFIDHLMKRKL